MKTVEPGYLVHLTVFDIQGRKIREIARNAIAGSLSTFKWDGLNAVGQPLKEGLYIILAEIFNLQGKKRQWKKSVALVRRKH